MRPHCASRRGRLMTLQHRSPSRCARRRSRRLVRSAPPRRIASTVTMHGRWPTCRGRITTCAYSYASACGFVRTPTVCGASSQNGCPPWPPLEPGATLRLAQLRAQHAAVDEAIDLAEDFATLVCQRQPEHLDPWLQRVTTSTLEAL